MRHFIIYYIVKKLSLESTYCHTFLPKKCMTYPNYKEITEFIQKEILNDVSDKFHVYITNINELNEQDFKEHIKDTFDYDIL